MFVHGKLQQFWGQHAVHRCGCVRSSPGTAPCIIEHQDILKNTMCQVAKQLHHSYFCLFLCLPCVGKVSRHGASKSSPLKENIWSSTVSVLFSWCLVTTYTQTYNMYIYIYTNVHYSLHTLTCKVNMSVC